MKITKLLSSLFFAGVVAFGATGCSNNELTLEEANKKIDKAAEKTQQKLKEEFNKDMFHFDLFLDFSYKMDVSVAQGLINKDNETGKVVSEELQKQNSMMSASFGAEFFGNFDSDYYKNLDTKEASDNKTAFYGKAEMSSTSKVTGVQNLENNEKHKLEFDYRQNSLRGVSDETEKENIVLPEDLDTTVGTYFNAILESLNAPKEEEEKVEMSVEEIILTLAYSTNDDDLIAMVDYLVETYDFENLTTEDIVDIATHLIGEETFTTPTMKAYLVESLNDIKEINDDKIIEASTKNSKKYNYVIYSLNYKELKKYINAVVKVFKDNSASLTGNEKVIVTTMITYLEEGLKTLLPENVKLSVGLGMKKESIMALSFDFGIEGFAQVSEQPNPINPSQYYHSSTTINELSFSLDLGYDFANEAYTVPTLDAYFAQ